MEGKCCFETEAGGTARNDDCFVVEFVDETFVLYDLGGCWTGVTCSLWIGVDRCVPIVDDFERRAENVAEFACYDILVFLGDDGNMRCLVSCKEFPGVGAMPPLCTIILLALTGIT